MSSARIDARLRQHAGANGELTRRQRNMQIEYTDARASLRMANQRGRVDLGPFVAVEAREHGWSVIVHGYHDQPVILTVNLFDDETFSIEQPGVLGG
ncbi:hypothetical protein [Methylobacterium dankookense]|uniref:Uncharacterized protein n=1 Tax=Methylobacterium dankookense TaxID=560405 RepID=A0A564G562_9HYPH|nr:hypothetical protein [Methylobacterium dankookense]GJD58697.1 hypothetical protein IFDJLNFL_4620 [Methylobacterium dankookense]VUF15174.1 hypothetical protein MTDSW087_04909 [Methylobacterium dankookense]